MHNRSSPAFSCDSSQLNWVVSDCNPPHPSPLHQRFAWQELGAQQHFAGTDVAPGGIGWLRSVGPRLYNSTRSHNSFPQLSSGSISSSFS